MCWFEVFLQSRFAILLLPISWIWGLVCKARHFLYDRGFLKIHKVAVPVVSVGNIAVGGRGKTPLVILLGKIFSDRRVAILSRGYGDGDEMKVIARHLPNAKLYIDADRVRAANRAVAEKAELIILDDGFQHRRLYRDFDLVIAPLKDLHGRFIPAGDLRDCPKRLKQAIVIPKLHYSASCPVSLKGERVAIFCGIAGPARFKKTVESLGATVVLELYLGDHEPIGEKRLQQFYNQAQLAQAKYLLCTEKDEVKLGPTELPIHAVCIETKLEGLEAIIAKIKKRLDTGTP